MPGQVSFRGRSGKAWTFHETPADSAWAACQGVAIFAAQDACGWRVYKVMEISGRAHEVQPIWALAEAERYGADRVFLAPEPDEGRRRMIVTDIEAGFTAVCSHPVFFPRPVNRMAA